MKNRVDNPRQPGETGPVQDQGPASWVETLAGVLLSFAITTAVPTLYWLENGWVNVGLAIAMAVFLAAFMLAPAYFGLTRQTSGAGRA